jgi:hypothetical protein
MVFTLPLWITAHVEGLCYGYAIWKGDFEVRLIACAETLVLMLDIILIDAHPHLAVEIVSVMIELGVALSVALRSDKAWPLAYSATVVACALTTLAQMIHPVSLWAYVTAELCWFYLECLILVLAASRAARSTGRLDIRRQGPSGITRASAVTSLRA